MGERWESDGIQLKQPNTFSCSQGHSCVGLCIGTPHTADLRRNRVKGTLPDWLRRGVVNEREQRNAK